MKKIFILIVSVLFLAAIAQAREVVTFKNGSIVRGDILEYNPAGDIKIKTPDNSIIITDARDIVNIETDKENGDGEQLLTSRYNDSAPPKNLAPKGYRGFVNIAPLATNRNGASIGLFTTHGYQTNHNTFIGAGVGFLYSYRNSAILVPLYASVKGNVGRGIIQYTYGFRAGYAFANEAYRKAYVGTDESMPGFVYINFNTGARIPLTSNFAIRITPLIEMYIGTPVNVNYGISVGVEF